MLLAFGILVVLAAIFILYRFTHRVTETKTVPAQTSSNASAPEPVVSATPVVQPAQKPVVVTEPPLPVGTDRFVIALSDTTPVVATDLATGGYITDASSFVTIVGAKALAPGGYKISKAMTPAQLAQVLEGKPYMKWVVIPEGLRKEEIAALLKTALGWTTAQENTWITKDTTTDPNYIEGVYFPDTYLLPLGETPTQTGDRLIAMFNQVFAPELVEFNGQNIKWTTGLTFASIIQREAANDSDMPIIAGILWNRLNAGMPLDIDATVQYARGNTGSGWWAPISVADESIDSPYNTYLHKELPPHPISNPGIPAIEAVLHPETTTCLYYLHDDNGVIHCADTYAEQQANVQKYLIQSQ